MAERRNRNGYRNRDPYHLDGYYDRGGTSAPKAGAFLFQLTICAVALLCLLGGWASKAEWFAQSKALLLAQMNAEDQTQAVGNLLSGFLPGGSSEETVRTGTTPDAADLDPDASQADATPEQEQEVSAEKLAELYRYIEQYGADQQETTELPEESGMGGYLPVRTAQDPAAGQRYAAPEGCLLSPVAVSASPLLPLRQATVTSRYGYRIHPVTGELDFHTGIDLAAAQGTKIWAAWPGTVEEVGWSDIYGNYALVSHSGGLATFYAHCDSIAVQEGMVLRQGELIGYVGTTGLSTGPHLHWEIRVSGMRVDPAWALGGISVFQEEEDAQ